MRAWLANAKCPCSHISGRVGFIMSKHIYHAPCFLCQSPSRWKETDHANRRHYFCSSTSCGEYEISIAAMDRIENNPGFKRMAAETAAQVKDSGEILEIRMSEGPGKEVKAEIVRRRPSLGGGK